MHIQFFLAEVYVYYFLWKKSTLFPLHILNSNDLMCLLYSDFEEMSGQWIVVGFSSAF